MFEDCKCDDKIKGVFCQYKGGCRFEKDCQYAEEHFDKIMEEIPHEEAAEMNLLQKKDRILLFQGILYNKINGEEYLK